jgi:DNA helicase IV
VVNDDAVMNMVLPARGRFPHAEERRLLYVALARTREHVWLLADVENPSVFALELALDPAVEVIGDSPRHQEPCPLYKTGLSRRRPGADRRSARTCSNAPLCPPPEAQP